MMTAWTRWRRSTEVADGLILAMECPMCAGREFTHLFKSNNLSTRFLVDRRLRAGNYSQCLACGTIFARTRPSPDVIRAYYELFPEVENRNYAIYPPPATYLAGKSEVADELTGILEERGLLHSGMAVFHVRCDAGALLAAIRRRLPDADLGGSDYFATNVRYAREQGFHNVAVQSPAKLELPAVPTYDLIVANHAFTHSLNPRADLRRLAGALKPGGHLFVYNENDHSLLFDPASRFYTRADVISYHLQLFTRNSFEAMLRLEGWNGTFLGHRKFTMNYLCGISSAGERQGVLERDAERERELALGWYTQARRYRYIIPVAKASGLMTLRTLARRRRMGGETTHQD